MKQPKLIKRLAVNNQLGEGIQWHVAEQAIWWTDIENSTLYRYHYESQTLQSFVMPERVGCFAFSDEEANTQNEQKIIAAFASGVGLYQFKSGKLEWLSRPEEMIKNNRFNDGRVDRQGRFWAGTMVEQQNDFNGKNDNLKAALYCFQHHGGATMQCQKQLSNLHISNGLCWSPDGKTLYHADSPTRQIHQYNFCTKTAKISDKKLFVETEVGCFPDGACTDAAGYLWSAQWGGSKVVRYAPSGEINLELTLPVSQPSCIAIGGANFDLLFITTAKQGLTAPQLEQEPFAGDVFIYQLDQIQGLAESLWRSDIR